MQLSTQDGAVELAFAALSDRTRLRILGMLRGGETCVCDLVAVLMAPQPKVSRHLAYLRRAGLVRARKDGLWMHYRLAPPRTAFHKSLMGCLACCERSQPQLQRDKRELARSKRSASCLPDCCP